MTVKQNKEQILDLKKLNALQTELIDEVIENQTKLLETITALEKQLEETNKKFYLVRDDIDKLWKYTKGKQDRRPDYYETRTNLRPKKIKCGDCF